MGQIRQSPQEGITWLIEAQTHQIETTLFFWGGLLVNRLRPLLYKIIDPIAHVAFVPK